MSIIKAHHVCIQTDNYEKSLHFYTKILGFKILSETPNFHGRDYNTWLGLAGFMIELQTPKKDEHLLKWSSSNAGPVHIAFLTDSVDEEYKRIVDLGHTNFKLKSGQAVYEVLGGKLLKVKAPEGTEIEFRENDDI